MWYKIPAIFLGSDRRPSTIIDVTHLEKVTYVGRAVVIGEGRDPYATYDDAIFWQIDRNSRRDGTERVLRLDLGGGWVATRRWMCRSEQSPRQPRSRRSRRAVVWSDDRAKSQRIELPWHRTLRRCEPRHPCSDHGRGNSGKIKGRCAERQIHRGCRSALVRVQTETILCWAPRAGTEHNPLSNYPSSDLERSRPKKASYSDPFTRINGFRESKSSSSIIGMIIIAYGSELDWPRPTPGACRTKTNWPRK